MPKDCSREIYDHIQNKIRRINNGYIVVSSYADGCDEYGFKYWVDCKNGWTGRSWDVTESCYYSIASYLNDISINGLKFGGSHYYIHPDIVFNGQYQYNTINSEEYNNFEYIREKLEVIRNKIIKGYNNYMKDKSYWSHYGPWYNGLEGKILCSSIDNFKKSLIVLVSHKYTTQVSLDSLNDHNSKIMQIIKWGKPSKEELNLLGF